MLADFGLSIEAGLSGEIEDVCGTLDYLAPEQWQAPAYDSQADVWQLACTFIEFLAGLHDTWISTVFGDRNPLKCTDLTIEEAQNLLYHRFLSIMPEEHPAMSLVAEVRSSVFRCCLPRC